MAGMTPSLAIQGYMLSTMVSKAILAKFRKDMKNPTKQVAMLS